MKHLVVDSSYCSFSYICVGNITSLDAHSLPREMQVVTESLNLGVLNSCLVLRIWD